MCDKLGGKTGRALRSRIEQISVQENLNDDIIGQIRARLDEELSDEEFAAALRASAKTLSIMHEWAKWPPVETWDLRN